MVRKRTDDDSVTYWFPWKHPMARRRGLEFGVFDQTPPKTGSALRSSFLHKTTTTIRALPFAFFAAFARKHNSNVVSALRASPLERRKCTRRQFFALSMSASRSRTCFAQLRPRWVCEHCIYCRLLICSGSYWLHTSACFTHWRQRHSERWSIRARWRCLHQGQYGGQVSAPISRWSFFASSVCCGHGQVPTSCVVPRFWNFTAGQFCWTERQQIPE